MSESRVVNRITLREMQTFSQLPDTGMSLLSKQIFTSAVTAFMLQLYINQQLWVRAALGRTSPCCEHAVGIFALQIVVLNLGSVYVRKM